MVEKLVDVPRRLASAVSRDRDFSKCKFKARNSLHSQPTQISLSSRVLESSDILPPLYFLSSSLSQVVREISPKFHKDWRWTPVYYPRDNREVMDRGGGNLFTRVVFKPGKRDGGINSQLRKHRPMGSIIIRTYHDLAI